MKIFIFDMKVQGKLERKPFCKKCKIASKVVHQNMAYRRNFGENGVICDLNRSASQ